MWRDVPFKHVVIDDFLEPRLVAKILEDWPEEGWREHNHKDCANKRSIQSLRFMSPAIRTVLMELNGEDFIKKLEENLPYKLIPDPHIVMNGEMWGGGLHETRNGGFLNRHIDFNIHPTGVYRRANLLVYLNDSDGELLIGDDVRVTPKAGRAVIFETSEISWHGHPEPLQSDSRKSLAVYYYSANVEPVEKHNTIYK